MRQLDPKSYDRLVREGERAERENPLLGIDTAEGISIDVLRAVLHDRPRRRGSAINLLAGLGAVTALGAISYVAWPHMSDALQDGDVEQRAVAPLCDLRPGVVSALGSDACSVEVDSVFLLAPKDPVANPDGIAGAVRYTLHGDNLEIGGSQDGEGTALYIDVTAEASERYGLTKASETAPADGVTATSLFSGAKRKAEEGGQGAQLAIENCDNELANLVRSVRLNAGKFATQQVSESMLKDPSIVTHRSDFEPFTATPLPDRHRWEMVFEVELPTGQSQLLACPSEVDQP